MPVEAPAASVDLIGVLVGCSSLILRHLSLHAGPAVVEKGGP